MTITLEQLLNLIIKLGLDEPRPVGLWFVDRSAQFYWLLKVAGDELHHLAFPFRFYGIPLYHYDPLIATKEELDAKPYFCKLPGVWIEMSDGNHVRLADE